MEYTTLDGTQISRVGLGTWAIGGSEWGETDERESIRTCLAIFEHGINLIDTAPIYGFGRSEEIVGKAIEQHRHREEFYIATKCGLQWDAPGQPGSVLTNSDPQRIREELKSSLTRLRTDYIDLYFVHWPDPLVPLEDVAEVFTEFLRDGRICAIGVSNFSVGQMARFRSVAQVDAVQPPYNLFERAIDRDVLPYCREHKIAVLTYSSLCRSLLAGALRADAQFAEGDIRRADPKFQQPRFGQYLNAVDRLDAFARQHYGKTVLDVAVRWVLDQPGVSAALWGAKRPDQIAAVESIVGWSLDERALAAMDEIVAQSVKDPVGPEYLTPGVRLES